MVRSIRRIPVEQRWSRDCVEWVQWVPWNRYRDAPDADGDLPEGVPAKREARGIKMRVLGMFLRGDRQPEGRKFFTCRGEIFGQWFLGSFVGT